ncbi:LacI family DNA-binding transcriptional regulator [Treponema zioleckii]|uniref:LacI family DNA-binding transcriptional regulator n=1 Tax=Treponema zioleckii TaxID=331680 RepID=UPI00168BDB18|nr:LacI family DNA-binding transcriptional regulator [Treponema zioleckii]
MTIKDIAKECGVGVGTVSRVLNGQAGVSEAMREKVQQVIDKYDFVLNQNAKLLKEQERHTILILVKGMSSILLNSLLECIQKRFEELPYTADVVVLDEYENEAQYACRIFYARKPIGIVFLGGTPDVYKDDFAKLKVPCVLISNQAHSVNNSNLSSISIDDCGGSSFTAEFLIKNGHRQIGVIGGELESSELSRRRYQSFLTVLESHGIPFDFEKQYVAAKYSFEGGAQAAKKLLDQVPNISAIFTMADVMAIGAMRTLADRGYSVPRDISVTGFDGLEISQYCTPRLTTIRQKTDLLAEQGLALLLKSITEKAPNNHILIPFEFIEGESVSNVR